MSAALASTTPAVPGILTETPAMSQLKIARSLALILGCVTCLVPASIAQVPLQGVFSAQRRGEPGENDWQVPK
jgi:hypothetical protein